MKDSKSVIISRESSKQRSKQVKSNGSSSVSIKEDGKYQSLYCLGTEFIRQEDESEQNIELNNLKAF